MVEAKITVEFDVPAWMDVHANIREEKYAAGFKVTHDITHPDYLLLANELGGNTSQKGDGYVGALDFFAKRG